MCENCYKDEDKLEVNLFFFLISLTDILFKDMLLVVSYKYHELSREKRWIGKLLRINLDGLFSENSSIPHL